MAEHVKARTDLIGTRWLRTSRTHAERIVWRVRMVYRKDGLVLMEAADGHRSYVKLRDLKSKYVEQV